MKRTGILLALAVVVPLGACGHKAAGGGDSGAGGAAGAESGAAGTGGASGQGGTPSPDGAAGSVDANGGDQGGDVEDAPGDGAPSSDGASTCPVAPGFGGGETSVNVTSATAAIVDETGAPVANLYVDICGIDICWDPAKTGPDGKVTAPGPQISATTKKPALKYGDTIDYAEFVVPLSAGANDLTTGSQVLATGRLSDKPGAALVPGASATSGDVTISIAAGGMAFVDGLVYGTSDQQKFRAVNVPLTHLGPVLASATVGGAPVTGFALVYGVAPSETLFCPAAKVKVALPHETSAAGNDLGWAPGTAVEFWIMTVDPGQRWAPYAGWARVSDGVVSADGASVATLDGEGFPLLDNFAIRKKP